MVEIGIEAGEVISKGRVQSLSKRVIRRDEEMDFANVLFPLPGCPFIAIITAHSNFAIFIPSQFHR